MHQHLKFSKWGNEVSMVSMGGGVGATSAEVNNKIRVAKSTFFRPMLMMAQDRAVS